jgi:CRISPR-associated endonuclease Csn1
LNWILPGLRQRDKFNLGEGGETRFVGNKTAEEFIKILGERWYEANEETRRRWVQDYLRSRDETSPMTRTIAEVGLDAKAAKKLAEINLGRAYCAYSLKSLRKLLPELQEGFNLYDSLIEVYGQPESPEPAELLPPVAEEKDIRNPVVQRSLTELRKVMNAIVREYGKPVVVRIELARDMKKSDKDRQEIWKRNRVREAQRKRAEERAREILSAPTRADIEKVLLLDECGGFCPYTGKPISIEALLGASREFDVEHIIPFSRCLDDSFVNKTLSHNTANLAKGNRTPFEAFSGDTERWGQILDRVRKFKGDMVKCHRSWKNPPLWALKFPPS